MTVQLAGVYWSVSSQVTSRHVRSRHATSRHVTRHVTSRRAPPSGTLDEDVSDPAVKESLRRERGETGERREGRERGEKGERGSEGRKQRSTTQRGRAGGEAMDTDSCTWRRRHCCSTLSRRAWRPRRVSARWSWPT